MWRKQNPNKRKQIKLNFYEKDKSKNPHIYAWRGILSGCVNRMGVSKNHSTLELLGYSPEELMNHLESLFTDGMTWENYGEWHIDHIKPVSSFDNKTPFNIVNALSNLQPLWATTREINGVVYEGNLNKGNHLDDSITI